MINGELSVFLLTCMSPNTNVTHGIKAKLVSFWSFGMYLSFEPKKFPPSISWLTINKIQRLRTNGRPCNHGLFWMNLLTACLFSKKIFLGKTISVWYFMAVKWLDTQKNCSFLQKFCRSSTTTKVWIISFSQKSRKVFCM